ncbi:MAG: MmgE/PrpD family protein, partial [Alphaproteobacteria bacterium]|nr:MmgE/PrpD family protein [Alphaproteobacteria bacterium]
MDATTEKLVDYAMGVRYEDMSAEIVAATKQRILDTLGCVAGAYDHPMAVSIRNLSNRYTMDTPSTILGTKDASVAPEMAAFANGAMLRLMDLSDTYRVRSGGHPSDIIAAVLAAAGNKYEKYNENRNRFEAVPFWFATNNLTETTL